MKILSFLIATSFFSLTTLAAPQFLRWTKNEDKVAELAHVIDAINTKTQLSLTPSDFLLVESRDLANNHFKMYVQVAAGIPVKGNSLRVWTDLKTGELIQAEAQVEDPVQLKRLAIQLSTFANVGLQKQNKLNQLVRRQIAKHPDDPYFRELKTQDVWEGQNLVRIMKVKAKHGTHTFKIALKNLKILSSSYEPFLNADLANGNAADEFSLSAMVYPIYEEDEAGRRQTRSVAQLKYIKKNVARYQGQDLYVSLKNRTYYATMQDAILGLTAQGQSEGYWAMADLKQKAALIRASLPKTPNTFAAGGVILEGRYATISLHPDAVTAYKGITFQPQVSTWFRPNWKEVTLPDREDYEIIPSSGFLGRLITSFDDAFDRPAPRLSDHDPLQYINDGFDEVQVYYSINTMFDSLSVMGFTDPELSTRPFHAFLYDPDISYKDNAYYTDDTINFTTYSGSSQNYARDNSTIWHELGHGVMDRLMGDSLVLADTGGLSEGMADFVAALVIENVSKGIPFDGSENFRIINNTGFHLTNEVHDDGEAYGGAMKDLLVAALKQYGRSGLLKVGDVTLEAMRLCRNHPALTAEAWFDHMIFADELGNGSLRAPGELKALIKAALAGRNFNMGTEKAAQMLITHNGKAVGATDEGSRNKPIGVSLAADETAVYPIQVQAVDGDVYKFQFPLTVKVRLEGGPLQGAIHWEGEDKKVLEYTLNSATDVLNVDLKIKGTCETINRPDGSCSDFAYVQFWPQGAKQPVAKKRFYLRLKTK